MLGRRRQRGREKGGRWRSGSRNRRSRGRNRRSRGRNRRSRGNRGSRGGRRGAPSAKTVRQTVEPVLHVVLGAAGKVAADLRPAVAQEVVQRAEEKVLGLRPAGFGETGNELVEPTLAALGEREGEEESTCLPVRPGMFSAMTFHFFSPYLETNWQRRLSSYTDHGT